LAKDIAAIAPGNIDVDSLRLRHATLQWNDELVWQRGSLNELQVDVGRIADGVAGPLSASARIDAAGAGVDARLQLKGRLMFDAAAGRIELARIESLLEGKAFGVDNLALNVKGDISALPREHTLGIDNVLASSMHKSGLTIFNVVLTAPELMLSEYRLSGTSLTIDASVAHPDRSATLALKVPRFEWAERALRDTTAQAQLTLRKADAQLRAQLSSPLALVLDGGARIELAAMDMTANATHPALASELAMQLKGRLDINLAQQAAQATWTGKLAGSDAKAEVAVADFVNRPRWTVDAEIARLDIDALLSSAWLAHWGDDATPFDAAVLRDANVQGRVRVAQAKLGGLQASAATARFELDKSMLSIAPITAQAYGAQLEAALALDATAAPRISAKGSLNEVDLRALMTDAARTPWLEGRGAVTWDLNSGGASVGTLRNSLAGVLNVSARGGALSGVDLRAALLDGRAELGKRAAAQPREFDAAAKTPFSEMKLRFDLREGRANGQGLEMNAAAIHAVGEGDLRLDSGALDLKLRATVGKGTHELASMAGVSVPMQVQGTWRAPKFAFDYGAATGPGVARASDVPDAPLAAMTSK
jgi:uncharacterized protein involved in outer membrane biogenesis